MYQSPFEVPQRGLTQIHPLLSRHSQPAWTYLPAASPAAPFCTLALRNLLPAKTALGACMGRCWGRCCSGDAEPGPTLGVLIWCGRPECSMAAVDRKRKVPGRQAGNALLDISSDEEEEVCHRALLWLLMRGLSCARLLTWQWQRFPAPRASEHPRLAGPGTPRLPLLLWPDVFSIPVVTWVAWTCTDRPPQSTTILLICQSSYFLVLTM